MRRFLAHRTLPDHFAVAAIDCKNNESMRNPRLDTSSRRMLGVARHAHRHGGH
jgi:hypothetical protein